MPALKVTVKIRHILIGSLETYAYTVRSRMTYHMIFGAVSYLRMRIKFGSVLYQMEWVKMSVYDSLPRVHVILININIYQLLIMYVGDFL